MPPTYPRRTATIDAGSVPPSAGGSCWSKSGFRPRRYSAKPLAGTWRLKQRALSALVVVEAVDDARRDEDEGAGRPDERAVPRRERELALDDEERVGVLAMDVQLCSTLAGAVGELGHRDLVGVDEQRCTLLGTAAGDRLARSRPGEDDEPGVAGGVLGSGVLVEGGTSCPQLVLVACRVEAAHVVAEPGARDVEVEEVRALVPGHREGVHDLGRDEDPGLRSHAVLAVLEPEHELALEDEERLRVLPVEMERRSDASSCRPHLGGAELLHVREEGDAEPCFSRDALGLADLDHRPAA